MKDSKQLMDLLKKNKNILAIGLEGGFGAGYQDKFSDMDILAISKNTYITSKLRKELKKENFEFHPHPEILKNLSFFALRTKDRKVEIKVIEKKEFNNKKHTNTKIIKDPENILRKAKIIKPTKKEAESTYISIVYPLRIKNHLEVGLSRKNNLFIYNIIHYSIENLFKIIYTLNKREYFSLKWAIKDVKKLKKKPKNFENRINKMIMQGNNLKDLNKKTDEILSLGRETYKLILKEFPGIKKIKTHAEWMDKKI